MTDHHTDPRKQLLHDIQHPHIAMLRDIGPLVAVIAIVTAFLWHGLIL